MGQREAGRAAPVKEPAERSPHGPVVLGQRGGSCIHRMRGLSRTKGGKYGWRGERGPDCEEP